MFHFSVVLLALFLSTFFSNAQNHIVKGCASSNQISFWLMLPKYTTGKILLTENERLIEEKEILIDKNFCHKETCSLQIVFTRLNPNTQYQLEIYNTDQLIQTTSFKTKNKQTELKDFSIITGSCGFTPIGWAKLLFPFLNLKIYTAMEKTKADFMLWLGDTVYYIRDDAKARKVRRNMLYRQEEKLIRFLESTPQIAMWDDHDFGPNNADGSYKNKASTLEVFKHFWPNPKPITDNGIYFKVSHYDVDFFILDNRSYSNKPGDENASILGKQQKAWLKKELRQSEASFKIICSGNQFVADYLSDKTFALYPKERQEIFNFLIKYKIEGVFFLTGDRHHTEVLKRKVEGLYPMLEYSCSPISSWPNQKLNSLRFNKKQRIKGTLINKRNFGKLSFKGFKGSRTCVIETIDKHGKQIDLFEIKASELNFSELNKVRK